MRLKNYDTDKPPIAKVIALSVKALTGVLGASAILTEQKPILSLTILCVGAVVNEVINLYKWDE